MAKHNKSPSIRSFLKSPFTSIIFISYFIQVTHSAIRSFPTHILDEKQTAPSILVTFVYNSIFQQQLQSAFQHSTIVEKDHFLTEIIF
ncbi:MAG: hypothetical protein DIZ77_00200 [endosymbiont of Seepiophila jonesi]|uniref:Uncharacterized protein n=1 Tax=endosymbiont of Lamellibrachia luymesi TaxID=2200907 RepID=A0A370DEB1_9GAMM|nr:MAG: hypothetical protein DIZ79_17925 [endosymbiont of Lamellibrachia luymesi]RDH94631.1 MAG: hypothetical protein DIZ77_00200 [endosymbiont of Seepiophila jonesi]